MILPPEAQPLHDALANAFTRPTFRWLLILASSAILILGRRTVGNLLRTAAPLVAGPPTTDQRILPSASWSAIQ
ncbi:hypothetical protein [Tautonia marina]|uniref:hypothetical protein n=1 Tax=Tautonia marina TaxID=2653855 RepID=UPI001260A66E|nr:hypothetical protein [Tautonia marina]